MKTTTPIKYFGGKSLISNKIKEYFPDISEYDKYIEPFGGSYSIGLSLDPIPPIEIYNDLEQNVYSLYKVLSNKELYDEFKQKCDLVFYSEDIRNEFKTLLKNDDLLIVDRAFYFFYVNRTSHNGIGGFSKNTYIRRSMSKSISDFLSAIDRLPDLHDRLSKVIITNTDGIKLINDNNDSRTLIYCDPPYHQSTRTSARYKVDMDNNGHIDFINSVINNKSKIIISGYDCELYDTLIDNGFKKIQFEVKTITGNFEKKTKIETLWINY